MQPSPRGPRGVGDTLSKVIADVATVELFCFLCHREDNNNVTHLLLDVCRNVEYFYYFSYWSFYVPHIGVYGQKASTHIITDKH